MTSVAFVCRWAVVFGVAGVVMSDHHATLWVQSLVYALFMLGVIFRER